MSDFNYGPAEYVGGILYLRAGQGVHSAAVGDRLIVNEQYVGLISAIDIGSPTTIRTKGADLVANGTIPATALQNVYGIWKVETFKDIGRAPLITGTQISLCEWPNFPYLTVTNCEYNKLYPYDPAKIDYYPSGSDMYTRRDEINLNSYAMRCIGIVIQAWAEHAHVNPDTNTFTLEEAAGVDTELPCRFKYIHSLTALASSVIGDTAKSLLFRKMWQWARETVIYEAAVKAITSNSPWYPAVSIGTTALDFAQQPGNLDLLGMNSAPSTVFEKLQLVPVNAVNFQGKFEFAKYYSVNTVCTFNGQFYVKLDDVGEVFTGDYVPTLTYTPGQIVRMPDGTYQTYVGPGFTPYLGTTPVSNWQLLTNRGYFDSDTTYGIYEMVTDRITGDIFFSTVATPAITLIKGVDNGWSYPVNALVLVTRGSLTTGNLEIFAMCPTPFKEEGTLVEMFSSVAVETYGSLLEYGLPSTPESIGTTDGSIPYFIFGDGGLPRALIDRCLPYRETVVVGGLVKAIAPKGVRARARVLEGLWPVVELTAQVDKKLFPVKP